MSAGGAGEAPLFAGKIHGVRSWKVTGRRLVGPVYPEPWSPGGKETVAVCERRHLGHGRAPARRCGCGLYAIHPWARWGFDGEVIGVVEAWGRVEVHADGFRAERARPVALFAFPSVGANRSEVQRLAAVYRCELVAVRSMAQIAAHCRRRGWGLARAAVEELVGPIERPEGPYPVAAPAPAVPAPHDRRWWAKTIALAPLWVAGAALVALVQLTYATAIAMFVYGILSLVTGWDPLGWNEEREPAALVPAPHVRVVDERVLPGEGRAPPVYVAELRNDGRRAAVWARPRLRVVDEGRVPPRRFDYPAVVPAGGTALVTEPLRAGRAQRPEATSGAVLARDVAAPGDLAPARATTRLVEGERGCRAVLDVRARAPLDRLAVWIMVAEPWASARNVFRRSVADVPRGGSRHVLERFRACPGPSPRLATYPRFRPKQLLAGNRSSASPAEVGSAHGPPQRP